MSHSSQGNETWYRLQRWKHGQSAAEGLTAQILQSEGFVSVDPSHPLGGPDGLKDIICERESKKWIGAAFFATDKRSFSITRRKFEGDFKGVELNNADGIAFVTNQELKLEQRNELISIAATTDKLVELYHLERNVAILNSPKCYGIRLEYLDIDMSKEEQIAYFAMRDDTLVLMQRQVAELFNKIQEFIENPQLNHNSLASEIDRVRNSLAPFFEDPKKRSISSLLNYGFFGQPTPTVDQLQELTLQLETFEKLLPSINQQLHTLSNGLRSITGGRQSVFAALTTGISGENVSIRQATNELSRYEAALDRVLEKQKRLHELNNQTD